MTTPAPLPITVPIFGALVPWVASTVYPLGVRVTNVGNIYQVATQGTSGNAGGPIGMAAGEADPGSPDGLTWNFIAASAAAWAPATPYLKGAAVSNDGGRLYQCIVAGTSAGSGGPTGAPTNPNIIADNTVVWTYIAIVGAQITVPTSRTQDLGPTPGSPLFSQYIAWFFSLVTAWIYYVRDLTYRLLNTANTWVAAQAFSALATFNLGISVNGAPITAEGATGDTNPAGVTATVPTNRKLWWRWQLSTGEYARLYYEGGILSITINAVWGGATWTQDSGADESTRYQFGIGGYSMQKQTSGHAAWADNAWVDVSTIAESTGELQQHGKIQTWDGQFNQDQSAISYTAGSATFNRQTGNGGADQIGFTVFGAAQSTDAITTQTPITLGSPANGAWHVVTTITAVKSDYSLCLMAMIADEYRFVGGVATENATAGVPITIYSKDEIGVSGFNWAVSGGDLVFRINGKAATTVNWTVKAEFTQAG